MYDVVKVVKGYEIKRMHGMKGPFHVTLERGERYEKFVTFRTIKAAERYILENL